MSKLYLSLIAITFLSIFSNPVYAQPKKGQFINANIGFGLTAPYYESEDDNMIGNGFYAQAEYVWSPRTWFGVRPYAGVIIASGESDKVMSEPPARIKSNAALLGAKVRIVAPIPYVAPFLESGIGLSVGSFETYTEYTNLKKNGVLFHIPFSMGLALGREHNIEVKFTYYYHESAEQFSGAVALGLTFPLDK